MSTISEEFKKQLRLRIASGAGAIWVYLTGDEGRTERLLSEFCKQGEIQSLSVGSGQRIQ